MNLNFPFYKRQQEYQSYKWNMPSHTRRQNCHKSSSGMIDRVPNKHFPNINGPQWQTEPVGKMPK